MKLMNKINALVLGLAVLAAVGCGKDDPKPNDPTNNTGNPKLTITSYNFFAGQNFIAEYIYDAQKRISRINYKAGNNIVWYETISYNPLGQVIRKDIISQFEHYLTYEYHPDGMLSRINNFVAYSDTTSASLSDIREFAYDTNKRISKETSFRGQNPATPVSYIDFTYPTDSTAVLKSYDPQNGAPALNYLFHTEELKFDGKHNPGKLLGVIDNTGTFNRGFKHNITYSKVTFASNNASTVYTRTYTYNAEGYPVSVTHLGPNNTTTEAFVYNWL